MPKLPDSVLGRKIVENYRKDDFNLIICYGTLRIGKSAYSSKVMGEVYDYFYGEPLSVNLLKKYMGWHPVEVVKRWDMIEERIPVYTWDDAGYWLFALDWSDPVLKAVQKYFTLIGTDINTIILTTPDPRLILKKILNMFGTFRVRIIKRDGGSYSPSKKWSRRAIGYEPYTTPDFKKHGVNTRFTDDFNCKFPDDVYKYYFPTRKAYCREAKKLIMDELLKKQAKKLKVSKELLTDLSDSMKIDIDDLMKIQSLDK